MCTGLQNIMWTWCALPLEFGIGSGFLVRNMFRHYEFFNYQKTSELNWDYFVIEQQVFISSYHIIRYIKIVKGCQVWIEITNWIRFLKIVEYSEYHAHSGTSQNSRWRGRIIEGGRYSFGRVARINCMGNIIISLCPR